MIKKNFNARKTLHAAIDTIRAINKLREGGALADSAMSIDPPESQNKVTDSRGNARGQTEQQIREQLRRVEETTAGLWKNKGR